MTPPALSERFAALSLLMQHASQVAIPREQATGPPRPAAALELVLVAGEKLPWPPSRRGWAHPRSNSPGRVKRTASTTAWGSSCQ
jgi:hypothetical protein